MMGPFEAPPPMPEAADATIEKLETAASLIAESIAELRIPLATTPYDFALAELARGVTEIPGGEHNPRILEYLRSTTIGRWGASRDETAWCSAYVQWCHARAGVEGTGSAMARSWLGWGVELDEPVLGCVVIIRRGKAPQGHVGFYAGHTPGGMVRSLGGNQDDAVSVKRYSAGRVLGYRAAA